MLSRSKLVDCYDEEQVQLHDRAEGWPHQKAGKSDNKQAPISCHSRSSCAKREGTPVKVGSFLHGTAPPLPTCSTEIRNISVRTEQI